MILDFVIEFDRAQNMMSHTQPAQTIVAESHAPPAPHECESALEYACERIVDAGLAGARWVILSEGYIPGYPAWVWALRPGDDPLLNALHAEARANTVRVPSAVTDRLCRVAQRAQVNVAIGVIERDTADDSVAYYNTLLFISAQGRIVGTYRSPCEATQRDWVLAANQALAHESSAVSRSGGI